jgi:hypothetical protein
MSREFSEIYYTGKSCHDCIHLYHRYYKNSSFLIHYCKAFPKSIPSEIYNNGHYEPRPDLGQKCDTVFEYDPNGDIKRKRIIEADLKKLKELQDAAVRKNTL